MDKDTAGDRRSTDPSSNVRSMIEGMSTRHDDLREESDRRTVAEHTNLRVAIVDLGIHLKTIMDERDRRYESMFSSRDTALTAALAAAEKAVATAMTAQEKAVAAAAEASEKAISKAEIAQAGVNLRGNEFRASLDDYTKLMAPRTELEAKYEALRDKIETQMRTFVAMLEQNRLQSEGSRAAIIEQINGLRLANSRTDGTEIAAASAKDMAKWVAGLAIMTLLSLLGTAIALVTHFK